MSPGWVKLLGVCLLAGAAACGLAGLAFAASPAADVVDRFLAALKPAPDFKRQANAGIVLREMKSQGYIPFRPRRMDYTDYYPMQKSASVFGHDLVIVEEEYMGAYVGCCVSEGAGFVVRLNGGADRLEQFAEENKCRVEQYKDLAEFREAYSGNLNFAAPAGRYAEVSCRVRDEERR